MHQGMVEVAYENHLGTASCMALCPIPVGAMDLAMRPSEIETALLEVLGKPPCDKRLSRGSAFLIEHLNQHTGPDNHVVRAAFMEAVWALVARGLAYIDFSQPAPENWTLELTDAGERAIADNSYIPDNAPAYLKRIAEDIPGLTATARLYLEEALRAFTTRNYLSATLMLGVSAEAVFYDAAYAFCDWTPDGSGAKLKELLDRESYAYVRKFEDFQKRLLVHKPSLPGDFQQNLDLNLNSLLELLRLARNDVGHPTGVSVPRENAFQYLVIFPMLARRLYGIRAFCIANKKPQRCGGLNAPLPPAPGP